MSKLTIINNNANFEEMCEIEDLYHDFISKSKANKFKINLTIEEIDGDRTVYMDQEERILIPGN